MRKKPILDLKENSDKMIEETSKFLIELDSEYQKDIDIAKNRYKEFDELENIGKYFIFNFY